VAGAAAPDGGRRVATTASPTAASARAFT
jgi:hypothetical protein